MKKKAIRKLLPKAGLALKNGFYLETSWILSSIIELKIRRILALITDEKPGLSLGLDKCLRRFKGLYIKGSHPLLARHFEIRLIDELRIWKNKRNSIYHDMTLIHVRPVRLKRMVEEGIVLHQELNNAYKNFKKDWKEALIKKTALPAKPNEQAPGN
jgi:hypothetical protein